MPVVLRDGVVIEDSLRVLLGFAASGWDFDVGGDPRPASFGEPDLRRANRGGARISAVEIAAILERRRAIERALRAIGPEDSLAGAAASLPWSSMRQLFDAFAGIRGVGLSKMTKALHPKRPALMPMLDSVVQRYLAADAPGPEAPFGELALALVRGYPRVLDALRASVREPLRERAKQGHSLTEVRILDLLIWSVSVPS